MRVAALAATGALAIHSAASAEVLARWVALGPEGRAEARAVVNDATCPTLTIDADPVDMALRAGPDAAAPVRVCAAPLPAGAGSAALDGQPLPLPASPVRRIVVIGDTGCRIKGDTAQSCNDPAAWPFKAVADRAAALDPDLVIHVGDYLYRESPCPPADRGCAGSPHGDAWAAWSADFFTPAAALLAASPWVMVRGNHEICARAGHGWTRLLDPYRFDPAAPCAPHGPPYAIDLGGLRLVVLDVSNTGEDKADPALASVYRADYARAAALAGAGEPAWLVQHRPIRGVAAIEEAGDQRRAVGGDATLLAALEGADPPPVDLILSGHIHVFQALDFGSALPPQLIVGNSGTLLDDGVPADVAGLTVGGARVRSGLTLPGFGFLLLTRSGAGWDAEVVAADGAVLRRCRVGDGEVACGGT